MVKPLNSRHIEGSSIVIVEISLYVVSWKRLIIVLFFCMIILQECKDTQVAITNDKCTLHKTYLTVALSPGPLFFIEERGERGPGTQCRHMRKAPRNPGASDSSVKYHIAILSIRVMNVNYPLYYSLFQLFICCGCLLVFFHENSSRRIFQSRRGSTASSKPKFREIRRV